MAKRAAGSAAVSHPRPPKARAVVMLRKLSAEVEALRSASSSDQTFQRWKSEAEISIRSIFGPGSAEDKNFGYIHFWSPISGGVTEYDWFAEGLTQAQAQLVGMANAVEAIWDDPHVSSVTGARGSRDSVEPSDVFVVHGHDVHFAEVVARFLTKLGLQPVILHERPDKGQTIIEKFEQHATPCAFAVVLLTPDDEGRVAGSGSPLRSRARQNVLLELGYFVGKIGRGKVAALLADDVEVPSDFSGVLYIPIALSDWKVRLARELRASGLTIVEAGLLD